MLKTILALLSLLVALASPASARFHGGVAGPAAVQYLGQQATRSYFLNTLSATVHTTMSRTKHWARDNMTTFYVRNPNWYVVAGLGDTSTGAPETITQTVEYPAGTCTRETFSSSNTGTIPTNATLQSDPIVDNIPAGSEFWIWTYRTSTGFLPYLSSGSNQTPFSLDGDTMLDSGAVDDTACVPFTGNTNVRGYYPSGIIGMTARPSIGIIADSRGIGAADTPDYSGDSGDFTRSIGGSFGYLNGSVYGDTANSWSISHANRVAELQFNSEIFIDLGTNDLTGGLAHTDVQVEASLALIAGLFSNISKIDMGTVAPVTTSSNGWKDLPGQAVAPSNVYRVPLNTFLRAKPSYVTGQVFDISSGYESSFNSGLWTVANNGGYANYLTGDGTHGTGIFNRQLYYSGLVTPAMFSYPGWTPPAASQLWTPANLPPGVVTFWWDALDPVLNEWNGTLAYTNMWSKPDGFALAQGNSTLAPTRVPAGWSTGLDSVSYGITNATAYTNSVVNTILPALGTTPGFLFSMVTQSASSSTKGAVFYGGSRKLEYSLVSAANRLKLTYSPTALTDTGTNFTGSHLIEAKFDVGSVEGFIDGNPTNPSTVSVTPTTGLTGEFYIGFATTAWVGAQNEVLGTNALTLGQEQCVEGYYDWRWGLQANLPIGHPYASAAPTLSSNCN